MSAQLSGSAPIVLNVKTAPQESSGKTAKSPPLKTDFADASHWDALAAKHLPRYTLPAAWREPATADALALWLDRMDVPVAAFKRMGAYRSLQDALDLNPRWPLRALIGLALEVRGDG